MTIDPSKFVTMASPVAWYETAEELHEQANNELRWVPYSKPGINGQTNVSERAPV